MARGLLALAGIVVVLLHATCAQMAPSGVYLSLVGTTTDLLAEAAALRVADEINAMPLPPSYSGQDSSGNSYVLSNFFLDTYLGKPVFYPGNLQNSLNITYDGFTFLATCDYSVTQGSWPHVSESGWVEIVALTNVPLSVVAIVDYTGPSPVVTVSEFGLDGVDNILITVQCTDTFCLIPTSDIADAIAADFMPDLTAAVLNATQVTVNALLAGHTTTVELPLAAGAALFLRLNGTWQLEPNHDLVVSANGAVVASPSDAPPFATDPVPPQSFFEGQASMASVLVTNYTVRSALWTTLNAGLADITITPADVPANPFVSLSTDSALFTKAVPGLLAYPGMGIDIALVATNAQHGVLPQVASSTKGMAVSDVMFNLTFVLSNASLTVPSAFVLGATFQVTLASSAAVNGTDSSSFDLNLKITGVQAQLEQLASVVGPVSTASFLSLIDIASLMLPPISIPAQLPSLVHVRQASSVDSAYGAAVLLNFTVSDPTNTSVPCTDSLTCEYDNTCCQGPAGKLAYCCVAPDAVCCLAQRACCPSGTVCVAGGCADAATGRLIRPGQAPVALWESA